MTNRVLPYGPPDLRPPRLVLLAAPALLVLGWALLIANAGRGANDTWAVGHLILFAANGFWTLAVLRLQKDALAGGGGRRDAVALALVIFGTLCVAGQLTVDLVAWALAMDAEALRSLFTAMRAQPVLAILFYLVGPPLLFLGIFLTSIPVARERGGRGRGGVLVSIGLVVVLVGALSSFSVVTLAGYAMVLLGFGFIAAYPRDHGP